jgi:hypothetical protein
LQFRPQLESDIIGFGVAPVDLDGPVVCRMFNRAIAKQKSNSL